MNLYEFIEAADRWQKLGWAVQSQAHELCEGGDLESKNPNTLEMIWEFLDSTRLDGAGELADEIRDYLDSRWGSS